MKTKSLFTVFFIFISIYSFAQQSLNDYKYVIVPIKYDFLKQADKYQLNSLTHFLFEKYGFTALMEDEQFPSDLANNRCLALFSNIKNNSGMFTTKLQVELKDCNNKLLFTSQEGDTREKDYKKAYIFALREAFKSIEALNYSYKPNDAVLAKANKTSTKTATSSTGEIEKLKEEIKELKKSKEVIAVEETRKVETKIITPVKTTSSENVLYAQAITNGYQVVDSTPRVVMILLQTSKTDTYIVKDNNAIVYKEDGFWYISKNDGQKTSNETLNIKF